MVVFCHWFKASSISYCYSSEQFYQSGAGLSWAGDGAFDGLETDLPPPPPNILVCGRSEMQIFTFYENSLIFPIKLNAFSSGGCKQWTMRIFCADKEAKEAE